jgi:hypothetical protein
LLDGSLIPIRGVCARKAYRRDPSPRVDVLQLDSGMCCIDLRTASTCERWPGASVTGIPARLSTSTRTSCPDRTGMHRPHLPDSSNKQSSGADRALRIQLWFAMSGSCVPGVDNIFEDGAGHEHLLRGSGQLRNWWMGSVGAGRSLPDHRVRRQ